MNNGGANMLDGADFGAYVGALVRNIPDFPKPGILFKDITPLIGDAKALRMVVGALAEPWVNQRIDAVVGIESRGFIFGAAVAMQLDAGFVPLRKPGKLPSDVDSVTYQLEYGSSTLEMHRDALRAGDRVLIVDDLLATGGTAAAAVELVRRQGGEVAALTFVVELAFLQGRSVLGDTQVRSLLVYGEGE